MSISGFYPFGELVTKSGKVINFDEIDRDGDGKISQREFNFIQKELCLDTVELTDVKQKGEKQVTDYEFVLWFQESQMQELYNNLSSQIAKDFIGANAKFAQQVLKELRLFMQDYKESYINNSEPIGELASNFEAALFQKYEELKQEYLK